MRIRSLQEIHQFGDSARKQLEAAFQHSPKASAPIKSEAPTNTPSLRGGNGRSSSTITAKKSRVMRTEDGLAYCPYPSPDPFVAVIQRLESKFGRHEDGGLLLTEFIIDGGAKAWRFDIALISPFEAVDIRGTRMYLGHAILIEADGFGFHRSKDAFKNDRAKQGHALKHGFPVQRITNEDVRLRLDNVIDEIEFILLQPRLYKKQYSLQSRGSTQVTFQWIDDEHTPSID